jgi:hypothetical protein
MDVSIQKDTDAAGHQISKISTASVHECLRFIDLCAPCSCPQRPPEEQLPKQSLRFTLMQGNQAC